MILARPAVRAAFWGGPAGDLDVLGFALSFLSLPSRKAQYGLIKEDASKYMGILSMISGMFLNSAMYWSFCVPSSSNSPQHCK